MSVHRYLRSGVIDGIDYISSAHCQIRAGYLIRERLIRPGATPCLMEILSHIECEDALKQVESYPSQNRQNYYGDERTLRTFMANIYEDHRAKLADDTIILAAFEDCGTPMRAYLGFGSLIPAEQLLSIIKGFVWMIAYTLCVLQREFPGFVHHDLHLENVLINTDDSYDITKKGVQYLEFSLDKDNVYYVPYFGVYPKIIDYGNCAMPSEGFSSVSNVGADVILETNDMQHFLWYLYYDVTHLYASSSRRYAMIDAFLLQLDPQRYFSRLTKENTSMTPEQIVNHPVYADYRDAKPAKQVHSRFA